jgi:hypothetical protein
MDEFPRRDDDDHACADGCDPARVRQVAVDEDECSVCGLRGPIGGD